MYSDENVYSLVDLVYSAAADPAKWPALLEILAKTVRGEMGSLHHQRGAAGESNFSADWNVDTETIALYMSYYGFRNPLMTTRPGILQSGTVNTTQTLCGDQVFLKSEYYNDFLRYRNWNQCLALTLSKSETSSSNITIFRGIGAEAFGEAECQLMKVLMPHLQRAFQLHNRIQGLERKAAAAGDALEHLPTALIMLSAEGKALQVNEAAAVILMEQNALRISSRRLAANIPSENDRLQRLIHDAISTGNGKGWDTGGAMIITREFKRGLQILVVPLRTRTIQIGKDVPAAVVFISDPDRQPESETQVFAQLFGLTRAEARLAQILAAGDNLKDACERLGVANSTVKSQLKSIFAKTNTSRQSQLVRLILLSLSKTRGAAD